jgi:murein L,D-transpeptidase YcbB/YkuD
MITLLEVRLRIYRNEYAQREIAPGIHFTRDVCKLEDMEFNANSFLPFTKYFFYVIISASLLACDSKVNDHTKQSGMPATKGPITSDHIFPEGYPINDTTIGLFVQRNTASLKYAQGMRDFYRKRGYAYVWLNKNGITPHTGMFINLYRQASGKSLMNMDSLYNACKNRLNNPSGTVVKERLQLLELKLTADFFAFADKEWSGNDENILKQAEWFIPKRTLDYEAILDTLLQENRNDFKAPVYRQYALLMNYLDTYRKMEIKGGWQAITPQKVSYKLGDSSAVITAIKNRLRITGDYTGADTSIVFDKALEEGVQNFQSRYGMTESGVADKEVMAEMNIPIHKRIEQIMINIERCRWVPAEQKGTYIVVNIPEFKLHAYDSDLYLWNMNVVLGTKTNKTVIFNGTLRYIVFNPYWNVPTDIFIGELLPKIKENIKYLEAEELEIIKNDAPDVPIDPQSFDWHMPVKYLAGYTLRQKPGGKNALGKVKFLFPNEYDIYLHDTPGKSLFERSSRSFSHGCIRLADPWKLALFLLKGEKGLEEDAIKKTIASGKEKYVVLKKGVPVFIAYFTAWVDRKGKLNFRDDIYGHDTTMAQLILNKPRI